MSGAEKWESRMGSWVNKAINLTALCYASVSKLWRRYIQNMRNLTSLFILCVISPLSVACSFPEKTDEEQFSEANRVFRAKVVATKLANEKHDGEKYEVVLATFKLLESYKGSNPDEGILKGLPFSPGSCMLPLLTGAEYVIYLQDNDFVLLSTGSWSYFNAEGIDVKPKLAKLREMKNESM